MILRRSKDRGHAKHGWLESWHTFSFAGYQDRNHMGYGSLRVINEDIVAPDTGFETHAHQNMEIITYMLSGELKHQDSMGNGAIIHPHEIQVMSAGTGIQHSEWNPSTKESAHLLQIWIRPNKLGVSPSWEQKIFDPLEKTNRLRLLVSEDGRDGSLKIHQDADVYASILEPGHELTLTASGNLTFIHVVKGHLKTEGAELFSGDALMEKSETPRILQTNQGTEILVFRLRE